MKKKLAAVVGLAAVLALGGAAAATADPYDPDTGTVTVMANGGTVYEDHTNAAQSVLGGVVVASVTVPAGRYEVTAKTWVGDTSTSANFTQCGLTNLDFNENTRATVPASGFQSLAMLGVADLAEETTIDLFCSSSAAAEANYAVLMATTISAINAQ